jgi:hypothetical protein
MGFNQRKKADWPLGNARLLEAYAMLWIELALRGLAATGPLRCSGVNKRTGGATPG